MNLNKVPSSLIAEVRNKLAEDDTNDLLAILEKAKHDLEKNVMLYASANSKVFFYYIKHFRESSQWSRWKQSTLPKTAKFLEDELDDYWGRIVHVSPPDVTLIINGKSYRFFGNDFSGDDYDNSISIENFVERLYG